MKHGTKLKFKDVLDQEENSIPIPGFFDEDENSKSFSRISESAGYSVKYWYPTSVDSIGVFLFSESVIQSRADSRN